MAETPADISPWPTNLSNHRETKSITIVTDENHRKSPLYPDNKHKKYKLYPREKGNNNDSEITEPLGRNTLFSPIKITVSEKPASPNTVTDLGDDFDYLNIENEDNEDTSSSPGKASKQSLKLIN